jgi:predicted RND superfamily exporter protein
MERGIRWLLSAAYHHRPVVLSIVAVSILLSAWGLRSIAFDSNVLNLLPRRGPALQAFRAYLETFGNLDRLYIAFDAPDGHVIADYDAAIADYLVRLRAMPDIEHVDAGLDDPGRDWTYLLDRRLLLLDEPTARAALARLRPPLLDEALQRARERLAVPSAEVRDMVREDPLGWLLLMRDRLTSEGMTFGWARAAEGYVSEDGRSRLVIARPVRPPQDTAFARRLNAQLDALAADVGRTAIDPSGDALPPLGIEEAGGYRMASEIEALIRRDGVRNGITSFVAIALLVVIVFRSARPLLLVSLPILLAAMAAVAICGSVWPLSTAATGSAAMLFGLGVDGTLLLFVGYLAGRRRGLDAPAAVAGLATAAVSMTIGFATTAATFLGLAPVDFPALSELGRIVGLGIVLCGAFTLLLIPVLVPRQLRGSPPRLEMPWLFPFVARRRGPILAVAGVLSVALGIAAMGLRVVPSIDRLQVDTEESGREAAMARRFGLPTDPILVLATGSDLDALLETSRRLDAALRTAPAVPVSSPAGFLPSASHQAGIADLLRDARGTTAGFDRELERAAVAAGFRPGALDGFAPRLSRLLDPEQRLTLDGYADHGLRDLVDRYVQRTGGVYRAVTYAYPRDEAERVRVREAVSALGSDLRLTGVSAVNEELAERFWPTFARGAVLGIAGVLGLVVVSFGSVRLALLSLLPTALGLLWSAGLLAIGRIELDLFSVFALLMSIGIGVDYGIHILHHRLRRGTGGLEAALTAVAPAIFLAAASTVLGFGSLMASAYAPLRTLGLVTALTVSTTLIAALVVMPAVVGQDT